MDNKPVFVLVHGAGLGGWCWQHVEKILRRNNFRVFSPTLSELSERPAESDPAPTLKKYIQDIIDVIKSEKLQNVVLVGHSFGGMVITGVADQLTECISRLVDLDAAVPKNGDDFASHIPEISQENADRRRQAFKSMARDEHWIDPIDPRLAGIADTRDIEWVKQRSKPHPVNTWLEKLELKTPDDEMPPRTYVLATNPPTEVMGYPAHGLAVQSSSQWEYREIDCGHAMMIACPERTAEILLEAMQNL